MLFNSFSFVIFYILITTAYFVFPHKYRWLILLSGSCYFYMAFVPVYILILGFTIVIDYIAGISIENSVGRKRKALLIISLVANIGILAVFKYYNFLNDNLGILLGNFNQENPIPYLHILLPIGLSFHTFQAMSYTIEVYRGNQKAERHFGIYSLYVMFYPQLVAGPIERPQNILPQMHAKHTFSYVNMVSGLKLMLWGFFKKLVVADRLSLYVDSVFNHSSFHNGTSVAIAAVFFAVQIYCDFSGYSDIAIGCARTMGFDLMKNFKRPYFSKSIKEFWSRWHISLSTWFRDYLYIPMGGNRVSPLKRYFNLLVVFLLSGIWHGANYTFIIWGFLHGLFLVFGQLLKPVTQRIQPERGLKKTIYNAGSMILTLTLVTLSWIFFRAASVDDALQLLSNLKTFGAVPFTGGLNNFAHCLLAIFLLFAIEYKMEFLPHKYNLFYHPRIWVRYASLTAMIFIIILFGVFSGGQFIYFQF